MIFDLNSKNVGVVIPIYKTEKYIQDCLESLLRQSHKNLSVVLVNDGSTDNSVEIAKRYVEKDERFVLIDKENFGQSSARNVGIEWFAGKYNFSLESNSDSYGGGAIYSYNVIVKSSYNIIKIYHNTKTLKKPNIDYIMFLDSDDYWHDDCVLETLKCANGVDIVWFGNTVFYDGVERIWDAPKDEESENKENKESDENSKNDKSSENKKKDEAPKNSFSAFCDHYAGKISREEIWKGFATFNYNFFVFAVSGMIDFNFFKRINLLFFDNITAEDQLFGTLLFLQADSVYILKKSPYVYRVRPNSTCGYAGGALIPTYLQSVYGCFEGGDKLRYYQILVSELVIASEIAKFLQKNKNNYSEAIANKLVPKYADDYLQLLKLNKCPPDIISRLAIVEPYLARDKVKFSYRLRLHYPTLYKIYLFLKKVSNGIKNTCCYIYNKIKIIERTIRRVVIRN